MPRYFCHPGPPETCARRWLLVFEDPERGHSIYFNEAEARKAFERAETMGWNVHLFESSPMKNGSAK